MIRPQIACTEAERVGSATHALGRIKSAYRNHADPATN